MIAIKPECFPDVQASSWLRRDSSPSPSRVKPALICSTNAGPLIRWCQPHDAETAR